MCVEIIYFLIHVATYCNGQNYFKLENNLALNKEARQGSDYDAVRLAASAVNGDREYSI